jgi:hypothetical protein
MSARWISAIAIAALALGACTHRVSTENTFAWQLRGAVLSVEGATVHVRHKSGQIVVLTVDDRTVYLKDKQPATLAGLTAGTRVTVDVSRAGGVDRAVRVQIFGGGRAASS